MQIKKVNPKMGFNWRAKHGLNKSIVLKTKIGLIWERKPWKEKKNVKEKKKKERRSSQASQRYGTTWTSNVLNGSPCLYSH